jgi:putative flippase GtrA
MRSAQFAKLWRYGTVSVISTVTTLVLLYLFFRVGHVSVLWSNVAATTIATLPSYYLNRNWAWGKSGKSHVTREVVPFWVIAFIGLVLSTWAVDAADHFAKHDLKTGHFAETLIVLGANFATYAVIWVGKFILFNKVLFADRPEGLADLAASAPNVPAGAVTRELGVDSRGVEVPGSAVVAGVEHSASVASEPEEGLRIPDSSSAQPAAIAAAARASSGASPKRS